MSWCVHECTRNVPGWEWVRVVHLMPFLTPSHPCMHGGDLAHSTKNHYTRMQALIGMYSPFPPSSPAIYHRCNGVDLNMCIILPQTSCYYVMYSDHYMRDSVHVPRSECTMCSMPHIVQK